MFKDEKNRIDKSIEYFIDGLVDHAVNVLINESPVWTGKYVESHIAEPTPKGYPRDSIAKPPPYPPQVGDSIKMVEKIKLKSEAKNIMRKIGKVSINNKAKHANFVEYLGWKRSKAHFPFGQTKESVSLNEKSIASKAKHKAFKR